MPKVHSYDVDIGRLFVDIWPRTAVRLHGHWHTVMGPWNLVDLLKGVPWWDELVDAPPEVLHDMAVDRSHWCVPVLAAGLEHQYGTAAVDVPIDHTFVLDDRIDGRWRIVGATPKLVHVAYGTARYVRRWSVQRFAREARITAYLRGKKT